MNRSREFPGGITNGAEWYCLFGGMQDWNYLHGECMEITLEVSYDKYPAAATIAEFWNDNVNALITYMETVHTGVHGHVYDELSKPIVGAVVRFDPLLFSSSPLLLFVLE